MKINLIVFFVLFFIHGSIILDVQPSYRPWIEPTNSQPLHTHGNISTFQSTGISEDFGPRKLNGDFYTWHSGIDYNSGAGDTDRGDLILALEGSN